MSNLTTDISFKTLNLIKIQYKIILLKLFVILSNILFVKAQGCTGQQKTYWEPYWFGQIKTCYLNISCPSNTLKYTHYGAVVEPPIITINCCNGYKWDRYNGKLLCIPVCSKACVNAGCTEPNTCTCYNRYVKSSFHWSECVPDCQPSCVRGTCIAPNTCKCHSNSEMFVNNQNQCVCKTGFVMNESGVCMPSCVPACVNGKCIAPNQCICSPGYQSTEANTCEAICVKNCIHGHCTEGNCICEDQWFGLDCNFTTTENHTFDLHHRFPTEIVLSLTTVVLFGFIYLLYKKRVCHCKQKSHDIDPDNFEVTNSLYGWVPK